MRGSQPAPRWAILLVLGLVAAVQLACVIPSLTNSNRPTLSPTQAPTPTSTTPGGSPGASTIVARISEEDANHWLQSQESPLGQGIDCHDVQLRIRRDGIKLLATIRVPALQNATVPVEIQTMPIVRGNRLELQVDDVQLGGPYAPMSGVVRSLLVGNLAQAVDPNAFTSVHGVRITHIELEDGFMVITGVPGKQ